jgi:hypothetical protein
MRLFIDENGKMYKAEKPKSENDMERMNPSKEQIDALPEDGSALTLFQYAEAMRLMDTGVEEIINEIA